MAYLSLLQKLGPPPVARPPSYLQQLQPKPAAPLPEGALQGTTAFALADNALLTTGHPATLASRLTVIGAPDRPQSRHPLYDGKPLVHDKLVALLTAVMAAWPADTDPPSIDIIRRAAVAHAFANPAADPWLNALRGWLAHGDRDQCAASPACPSPG